MRRTILRNGDKRRLHFRQRAVRDRAVEAWAEGENEMQPDLEVVQIEQEQGDKVATALGKRKRLFRAVAEAIASIGEADVRVTKSQIAFRRRKGFAYVWRPDRYLTSDVPAVLSIALPDEVKSPRFKQVAHPAPRVAARSMPRRRCPLRLRPPGAQWTCCPRCWPP